MTALTDQKIRSEVIEGSESPIQGWYSEDHHKKCAAPVLHFGISESTSVFVTWVLYPLPPGADAEQLNIVMSRAQGPGDHMFSVKYSGSTDYVSIHNDPKTRSGAERKSVSRISIQRQEREWTFVSAEA